MHDTRQSPLVCISVSLFKHPGMLIAHNLCEVNTLKYCHNQSENTLTGDLFGTVQSTVTLFTAHR